MSGPHDLREHLREYHGFLWRFKVRLLLVVGEPDQVNAIAPGLVEQRWLHDQYTVLLWGGSVQAPLDDPWWRSFSTRWRGLDGVVWALGKAQSNDAAAMERGVRHLRGLARKLGWQLSLYLWQVCESDWPQAKRETQPVGCLLSSRVSAEELETQLSQLVAPLRQLGLDQMQRKRDHDFLLRLSQELKDEGIARWRQALAPLWGQFARGVPLRGLWFSLALPSTDNQQADRFWRADPAWGGVLGDQTAHPRRLGWPAPRIAYALVLGLVLLWSTGLLLSFASNRAHIVQVQDALAGLDQAGQGDEQLRALNELMRELGRLDYRATHGVPWYQRFGLSQNAPLLETLWPRYVEANNRLLRDPAAANLQRQLSALVKLPADSPERAARATLAYDQLKAYLMMAHPEKADPAFLVQALGAAEPLRAGVAPGLWQGLAPGLWQFYAEQLAVHPQWAITVDPKLVAQARQVLLGQLGQRNAEANLYQQVLDAAANHTPDLNLAQMAGDTEAQALLVSDSSVPGVFTRQAWEGQVREAIDEIADARREQIDWVLSDRPGDIARDLTPDVLKQRLTERYFDDYASAWLDFLNRLRWQPARNLDEVIDQLTLMSDVRQSPLIALMNTLAYQGQAGSRRQALGDSLLQSAQKLIGQEDKIPAIDQQRQGPSSPLEATFGPLLALLGKGAEGANSNDSLSLQAFLNRVTRVRLKLQQVSSATDPQAMTQALAQTVFQGKGIDLTETQSYGSLIAASLGAEWGSVGHTLFVQPLDQAWERVLQPSAASFNRQWQRAIVTPWQDAFAGRYPFAA
ncbi:ImcF-related family protein, partial [Pseudomonas sp. ok602]|uniref:ImcF-related family protein n=2 Tax=unclassified Pseudomonas TaxID=196821 RepID=UPI002114E3B7